MKPKKDVLFLCQFFYPEHNSSATLPFDTAKYLAAQGISVDALVGYPKEYSSAKEVPLYEKVSGVNIHRVRYVQMGRERKLGRLINYLSFTDRTFLSLFKLRNYKCIIIYSNPPVLPIVAVMAKILFETKIVFVAYDVYPEVAYASRSILPGSIMDKGMCWINNLLYKRVSCVVALTDEMKDFLLKHRVSLTEERVTVIANWAHEKENAKATAETYERFGYRPEHFIVSYFGNMGICQEMETLVKAVEKLKEADLIRFLFIGHGNKKAAIEQHFKDQKLTNARMCDFMIGEEFEQAIAISSCCVVSLEKGLMGTCAPSKYYSYLQGGKPIISITEKDSYLAKEIEKANIGRAIDIGDVGGLVLAIENMAREIDIVKAMGKKAKSIYDQYYKHEVGLNKYHQIVKEML